MRNYHPRRLILNYDSAAMALWCITCKRVSAKHSAEDDFAFLWEHAIFRYPPNENPLTDRSELLHS
jgi:hypothetical protein